MCSSIIYLPFAAWQVPGILLPPLCRQASFKMMAGWIWLMDDWWIMDNDCDNDDKKAFSETRQLLYV